MTFQIPFQFHPPPGVALGQWITILVVGFVLIAFAFVKFVVPMITVHLVERREEITEASAQVESTLQETGQLRADYQKRLERIEDETEARMAEAVREANQLRDTILAEGRELAEGILRRSRDEAARERAKALVRLRIQYAEDVVAAAAYAASRSMDASSQERLVREFSVSVRSAS